jgi:hypothetical protein
MTSPDIQPDWTVTVTDAAGEVIFVGKATGAKDTLVISRSEYRPARLLCSVTDLSAGLTK